MKNLNSKMVIPVNQPLISKEAKENVYKSLEDGWISSAGPFVKKFEDDFAKYFGVKHAITVTNGTAALHISLLALGIGKGDEVIVPSFTMASSWVAVLYTGATPVFVDCELDTYNIDVSKIENKITKKTKAIMPVHIYGHACEMDEIMRLAKKYSIAVIEDAAEAHGGTYKGKKCGSIGDVGCFSFYANKIITTGEGGMVTTNNDEIASEARKLKDLYHSPRKRFIHEKIGFNYRMTNLQAALGCGELKNLPKYIAIKKRMAQLYDEGLTGIKGIKTPITKKDVSNVYWMYAIRINKDIFGISKDELRMRLLQKGIDTRDFFYPPEDQPILDAIIRGEKFPNAKILAEEGLYLPSGLALTSKQIKYVIKMIYEIKQSIR